MFILLLNKSNIRTRTHYFVIGVLVDRYPGDAYGPIDFRLDVKARIQDKTADVIWNMRREGGHPYNPDEIDILQVTHIASKAVYAFPMRNVKDGIVESHLTEEELMIGSVAFSQVWQQRHVNYRFDMSNKYGVQKYIEHCKTASNINSSTAKSRSKSVKPKQMQLEFSLHLNKLHNAVSCPLTLIVNCFSILI